MRRWMTREAESMVRDAEREMCRQNLQIILEERFGTVPTNVSDALKNLPAKRLQQLVRQAVRVASLDELNFE